MTQKFVYKDTGVDIELGDTISKIFYNAAKQTWHNREGRLGEVIVPSDDFSGIRVIDVANLPLNTVMSIGFDGIGTKIELAERVGNYKTLAYDLFAMVCDDAVAKGGEPVLVGSILDVNSLGFGDKTFLPQIKELAQGYIEAAKEANVAIVNGEVAELGDRVGGFGNFNCNWGAAVVWFAQKDRMFTGYEIKEGDYLVGLKESGFRSNGLSLVRKILHTHHGDNWHQTYYNGVPLGDQTLAASRIYSRAVVEMFGGCSCQEPQVEIHGISHITGGGMPGKVRRVLKPSKLGALVDNPFEPAPLMHYCQEKGRVDDKEAYLTWNMGQGMVIITPEPERVMEVAKIYLIDSRVIGRVTSDPSLKIKSKGYYSRDEVLTYESKK